MECYEAKPGQKKQDKHQVIMIMSFAKCTHA